MRILLLGGAGAMGSATARFLAESNSIDEVTVADLNLARARSFVKSAESEKLRAANVDITNSSQLRRAVQKCDVVANASWYQYNLIVTSAAIKAKIDYVDLGGLYHMTLRQLKLNGRAKKARSRIVLGCGCDPGLSNVLAIKAASELDSVRTVQIWDGERDLSASTGFKYSIRTILDEFTSDAFAFKDGKLDKFPPLTVAGRRRFPDPIGELECYYALHSEVATLPTSIPGVRNVEFIIGLEPEFVRLVRTIVDLDLHSTEFVRVGDQKVRPRDVTLAQIGRRFGMVITGTDDYSSIIVDVEGIKAGGNTRISHSVIQPRDEKWGTTATAYLTAAPFATAVETVASGQVERKGVLPPELAFEPVPFIAALARKGVTATKREEAA